MPPVRRSRLAVVAALIVGTSVAALIPASANQPERGKPTKPVLSIGDASANESAGKLIFPLRLDRPAPSALRVSAVPLRGTAQPRRDYQPGTVSTTIPAGRTEGTLEVVVYDDEVAGPDVSFTLRITSAPRTTVAKGGATGTILDNDGPLTINLLHINDHHSHLQPDAGSLNLGTSGGSFNVPLGGFPRITAKIAELESQIDNVVKIHAGDAMTGTLYYTLFKGEADANLMNTVCFDLFALGNHEFDDGDAALARFLDWLNGKADCETTIISANVVPAIGTPLAPTSANDYIRPYAIKEFRGQKVGFIGIDTANKTRFSSQPLPTTQFLGEVDTAQRYVNELEASGIDNIVLVTHYGYQNDLALAKAVTGVDAIIGGDSHTLLGDVGGYGLGSSGAYPTQTTNRAGEPVCIAQAWQYGWAVGELAVTFEKGKLAGCEGTPHLLLGDRFTRGSGSSQQVIEGAEREQILSIIEAAPELGVVAPDPAAQAILDEYAIKVDQLSQQVIGSAAEILCERRVPNLPRGTGECVANNFVAVSGAQLATNGGFIQQIVTDAFLARAFRADFALQNGGGVRVTVNQGEITIGTAYTVLPFSNTLVELELTGQEVLDSIEDGLDFYASNPGANTGAFPYGSAIRWAIDMTQEKGSRLSDVEVRDRTSGIWGPLDPAKTYIVVTNSFLAGGGDGYATFKAARDAGRVTDTFINYAQGLIDYLQQDLKGEPVSVPPPSEFSTRSFVPLP